MTEEFNPRAIKLIVGLGNPGRRYRFTYHNAGRLAALTLAGVPESKFRATKNFRAYRGAHHTFIIPDTFMNESGRAVAEALRVHRVKPDACLIIHDDTDLPLGASDLAFARGSAGHHGVESIVKVLGTKDFWRLRIGVRTSPPTATRTRLVFDSSKRVKAGTFVLRPMPRVARETVLALAEKFRDRLTPTPTGE
ncbi:MAG: aminoacyl-tRNA hydrolase [Candidatus Jorgensenbacteria bacterium]|nr:aminoacyl-tRNA hydrolase [Candidatus Jorgensenbacteria bacterium]